MVKSDISVAVFQNLLVDIIKLEFPYVAETETGPMVRAPLSIGIVYNKYESINV